MSATPVTRINRKEARILASAEFEMFADLAASLSPQEWTTATDCVSWDVRKMVLHVLGSADAQASPLVFLHQLRRGLPLNKEIDSHHWVDGMNELQVRERVDLTNAEVIAQVRAVGAKAVKGRFGTPLPMRYIPVPFGEPIGWKPAHVTEPRARRSPGRRHCRRVGRTARRAVRAAPDRPGWRHVQPEQRG